MAANFLSSNFETVQYPHMSGAFFRGDLVKFILLISIFITVFRIDTALATTRAVLIGVSDYNNAVGINDLKGPANDVRLLRDVLRARGITDITLLADGVDGATRPTRSAILHALAEQAEVAQKDDYVYLHFSGHGTRQFDPGGDESDGLDEVFLPADTGRAAAQTGLIENALVDDEIGDAVDAIRAKGAHVWLVLDSCHSGTGLRAGGIGGISRYVDPAALGAAVKAAEPGPTVDIPEDVDLPGGVIAFYSARADEVAREFNLNPGGDEAYYGLFTAKLAARLADAQGWSFRQLFQAVLADLNDVMLPGVARLQTPSWDGTLIDQTIFAHGLERQQAPRSFAMRGSDLRAGIVHSVADGTLMALHAGPADPEDAVLGYAQTRRATAMSATLTPVAADCVPSISAFCPPSGALPAQARFARIVARPVDLTVRIGPPRDLVTGTPLDPDHPAMIALTTAIADTNGAVQFEPLNFEVETIWDGKALWFGRRAALGAQPVGLSWNPQIQPLAPLLIRIARAEAFGRLMDGLTGGGGLFNLNAQGPVEISGLYLPSHLADLAKPGNRESPYTECGRAFATSDRDAPQPLNKHRDVKQCDRLLFLGQGRTDGIRDVNILHIDAQYCVWAQYTRVSGITAATLLGDDMKICSDCPENLYVAGDERIFIVVSEATKNAAPLRLDGLVETCADGDASGTRSAARSEFLDRLGDLAKRPDTRGSFGGGGLGVSNIWVERYDITVQPRVEVFRHLASQ